MWENSNSPLSPRNFIPCCWLNHRLKKSHTLTWKKICNCLEIRIEWHYLEEAGVWTGGDNSNKRCLSNTRSVVPEIWIILPNCWDTFPEKFLHSCNVPELSRVSRKKFPSVPIPGEISRFPEQFWLCPETAFVRVVTPRVWDGLNHCKSRVRSNLRHVVISQHDCRPKNVKASSQHGTTVRPKPVMISAQTRKQTQTAVSGFLALASAP